MRIAVFGATGRTGRRVLEEARKRGHEIRAISRNPPQQSDDGVVWRSADIRNADDVGDALDGIDAVISAVGIGAKRGETTTYSAGIAAVIGGMRSRGIRKLAVVSAAPVVRPAGESLGGRVLRTVLWWFFGTSYRDMVRMEELLDDAGDLEWTCLRPPYLRDADAAGSYKSSAEKSPASSITTGDLAAALVDAVDGTFRMPRFRFVAGR